MKGRPRSYRAEPEKEERPSAEVGAELGLPRKRVAGAKLVIGRREWIGLPEFGVGPLNARTDSGARSSSLHAEEVRLSADGSRVSFFTRDHYGRRVRCEAAVGGATKVKSSTGVARKRVWIETEAVLPGGFRWRVRLTLADREKMRCPMLLGRRALSGYFLIDTQGDHLMGGLDALEAGEAGPGIDPR